MSQPNLEKLSLPKRVTLELTNRCNRACEGCPRNKMAYPLGDMDWQLFTKIVDQLPASTIIVPFFRGESLLYPRFADAMEKLRKFAEVQLATNGDNLTGENERAILETCSFVSYSLHKPQFPNETNMLSFFYRALGNGVKTQVSILDTLVPKGKKEQFVKEWLNHVDRVRIYVEHSYNGFGDTHLTLKDQHQPCYKPFEEMVVYWDGKVALCNHDWDNKLWLGNLNEQSVVDVWSGKHYRIVRKKHVSGWRRTIKSCKDCDYWMVSYLPKKMFGELYTN